MTLITKTGATYTKVVFPLVTNYSKYYAPTTPAVTLQDGVYTSATGTTGTDANYEMAEFAVTGVKAQMTVSTGMNYTFAPRIVALDANKSFLSVISPAGTDLVNYTFTQPAGCAYIRVNRLKAKSQIIAYSYQYNEIDTIIDNITNLQALIPTPDLTPISAIADGYLSPTTGLVVASSTYQYAMFNVVPQEILKITTKIPSGAYGMIVFYDSFNAIISVIQNGDYKTTPVTVPLNCYKMGISNQKSYAYTIRVIRNTVSFASSGTNINVNATAKDFLTFDKFYRLGAGNPKYNFDVTQLGILVGGQSQFDGRIPTANFPATWTDGTVKNYSKSIANCKYNWNDETGVTANYSNVGNWGADALIYNKISDYLAGADFTVIKRTRGATSLGNTYNTSFFPDIRAVEKISGYTSQTYLWEKAIRNQLVLNSLVKIGLVLWSQGEQDMVAYNPQYYRDLCNLISYIRGVAKNPNLPFIFHSVAPNSLQYDVRIYNDMVRCSQTMNDVYFVDLSSIGATYLADGIHYDAATAEIIATNIFTIIKNNYLIKRIP